MDNGNGIPTVSLLGFIWIVHVVHNQMNF